MRLSYLLLFSCYFLIDRITNFIHYRGNMAQKTESFLSRLFGLFFPHDDVEAIKKRQLKALAKEIAKNKFGKWYKPSADEFQPQMAHFFYELYKVVGPARALLTNADSSKMLKVIAVEQNLSKNQNKLRSALTAETIEERAKKTTPKELAAQVRKELILFTQEFDEKKIEEIDILYRQLNEFIHFVLFDYYFLLKKFDAAFPEDKYSYVPKFVPVNGEHVREPLKDFAPMLYGLPLEADWEKVFAIITAYKNVQPVNAAQWKKQLGLFNDVRRSNILEKTIRHVTKDPNYAIEFTLSSDRITDDYIKKIERITEETLKKISKDQKSSQVAVLAQRVFGNEVMSGTKYYNPVSNAAFEKRGLDGYIYADALNYLKSFLVDYFKSDIRALSDLVLVRGQWMQQAPSSEYSESYHTLMQIATKILEFDEKVSEVSELGVKFRTLLSRMEREKDAGRQIQKYLEEVNDAAFKLLKTSIKNIITLGNAIKNCIADYDKPHRELLQNWKEVEQRSDRPIREWMNNVYTKIYNFITLEQVLLKKEE